MELIEGVDLRHVLRSDGPLPTHGALNVAVQIADGLQAIHEVGIIQRDLKTQNLMRDAKGVVRLMDFGIDGVAVGLTPLSRLRVGSGTHFIRCEHPGFEPLEREVAVQARELPRLVVDPTSEAIRGRP